MKRIWIWITVAIFLIAVLATALIARSRDSGEGADASPSPAPTSTLTLQTAYRRPIPTARPQTSSTSSKKGGVAIPGWSSIDLPADSTEADVQLYNPTDNNDKFYLVFELRLADSGETLFATGLVPPGQYCSRVTLTRALPAGTYEGIMHVQPVRMGDQSLTNNADVSIVIHVK